MTVVTAYADVESAVVAWLATTPVAPLVTRAGDGGLNIYRAMPTSAPLPAVVVNRVGGGPRARSDVPEDVARLSFDCWGSSRADAIAVATALVAACENLAETGTYVTGDGTARLVAAEVVLWLWSPDPNSDTPRYVVDALFSTLV